MGRRRPARAWACRSVISARTPGVAKDADLALCVLLELVQLHRRVDRHRHRAGQQHTQEAEVEIEAGGQHQRHRVPRLDPARGEPGRDRLCPSQQLAEAQPPRLAIVFQEHQVLGVGRLGGSLA